MTTKQLPEPGWHKDPALNNYTPPVRPEYTQSFLVTVTSDKPIEDLGHKISQRLWTAEGKVSNVTVRETVGAPWPLMPDDLVEVKNLEKNELHVSFKAFKPGHTVFIAKDEVL